MRPRGERCCRLAILIAALLLPATVQRTRGEEATAAIRVLFPSDQSIVESGRFELLCVLPEAVPDIPRLRIDGKRADWQPYVLPVLMSRLDLKPGRHTIAVGSTKLRVYVRGDDPLPPEVAEWSVFRSHPGSADGWKDCGACHEATEDNGRRTIGDPQEPSACKECHSSEDFQLAHFHPERPLATCHECHALHGSSEESLLRGPAKTLCAACHD